MTRAIAASTLLLALLGCVRAGDRQPPPEPGVDVIGAIHTNIRSGRVTEFRSNVDYFPDKTMFRHSHQLGIEYHGHYKVLTVTPAPNPNERFRYVLVQRGTPVPPLPGTFHVIEVPARNFALMDQELLGAAEIAGLADRLIGVSRTTGVRAPRIRDSIQAGQIVALGAGKHVDVERVIQLQPDVVMTYWSVNPSYDAHPVLNQAGIQTVVLAAHWETSLLAAAEWMKVLAVLFNRERDIDETYDGIVSRYESLAARARVQATKPVVLSRLPFRHIWSVEPEPPEVADAGGQFFWPGETRYKGVDIEAIARRGRDADAWIIDFPTPIRTQEELLSREPRLALFKPVRTGDVWNFDLQDARPDLPYHDRQMRPDLVLADLVKILHPSLAPEHDFVFYRRLDPLAASPSLVQDRR